MWRLDGEKVQPIKPFLKSVGLRRPEARCFNLRSSIENSFEPPWMKCANADATLVNVRRTWESRNGR